MIKPLFAFALFGLLSATGGPAGAQSSGVEQSTCTTLQACYGLGGQAFNARDYSAAVPPFAKGCEMGHGQSCFYAGEASKNAGDRPAARNFYRLACERTWEAGCLSYSRSLLDERGGPVDHKKAIEQLTDACNEPGTNQAGACQTLASAYSVGEYGLPLDNAKAKAIAEKSCDLGDGFGCLLAAQYED